MVAIINKVQKVKKKVLHLKRQGLPCLINVKKSVEKDLVLIKDTWYTQGVSIVFDG